jgi:hypothetical protein
MRGPHYARILAGITLALMLAAPLGASAQDSDESAATFKERFPADQTSTQPSLEIPAAKKEQNVAHPVARHRGAVTTRVVSAIATPGAVLSLVMIFSATLRRWTGRRALVPASARPRRPT